MNEAVLPFKDLLLGLFSEGWTSQVYQSLMLFFGYLYGFVDYFFYGVVAVPLSFLMPRSWRVVYLLVVSLIVIAVLYGGAVALAMILFPLFIHLLVRRWQAPAANDGNFRKKAIAALVVSILLFYAFLLLRETYHWSLPLKIWPTGLMIPFLHFCGVAYMLPKLLHYAADGLQGKIETPRTSRFLLYMIFFPTLRVGPIERFQNFNRDIEKMELNGVGPFDIGYGMFRVLLGGAKMAFHILVIMKFMEVTLTVQGIDSMSWARMYFTLPIAVLGVYLSFGGYSDIAIGFARMSGFSIMENFYRPFASPNIGEWWRRWHISLSFWLRDYVYRPLGGNRRRATFNILVTFFVCGLWHGLAPNYIIWGIGQGIGLAGWMYWRSFWWKVAKGKHHKELLPLRSFMRDHPRFAHGLGIFITINYFCLVGIYFIFDVDRANFYFLRYVTFGLFQLN